MSIDGDTAANMTCIWEVRALLDENEIAAKRFTLARLPDLLEVVRFYRAGQKHHLSGK